MTLLTKWANWKTVVVLILLALPFNGLFFPWRTAQLIKLSSETQPILDARFAYTPQAVYGLLAALGGPGRQLYRISELTLDLLYPVLYNLLLSLLLVMAFRGTWARLPFLERLSLLPVLSLLADYGENASLVTLMLSYPKQSTALAQLASGFTTFKWLVGGMSLTLILFGFALSAVLHLRSSGA